MGASGPVQSKRSQQTHHVVVVLFGCSEATDDPIEQVRIGALEQSLETVELGAVEICEMDIGKPAKNEVALLRPAMPAPKQEAPAADIRMFALCGLRNDMSHDLCSISLLRTAAATHFSAASADSSTLPLASSCSRSDLP